MWVILHPYILNILSTNWILASTGESAPLRTGRIKIIFNIQISIILIKKQIFVQKPSWLNGMKIDLDKKWVIVLEYWQNKASFFFFHYQGWILKLFTYLVLRHQSVYPTTVIVTVASSRCLGTWQIEHEECDLSAGTSSQLLFRDLGTRQAGSCANNGLWSAKLPRLFFNPFLLLINLLQQTL